MSSYKSPDIKKLKESKNRIQLWNGIDLQFHKPLEKTEPISLKELLPADKIPKLEIEIGCGKGEFIERRARKYPERFFVGIDRRSDRFKLTQKKLLRVNSHENWILIKEDARAFLEGGLPPIQTLHVYHPDPWPKSRHHKHRFFRSPDARLWAEAIVPGGELRLSSDHGEYFSEILDIIKGWDFLLPGILYRKEHFHGSPMTHFEKIFLSKKEPVYKGVFTRV